MKAEVMCSAQVQFCTSYCSKMTEICAVSVYLDLNVKWKIIF